MTSGPFRLEEIAMMDNLQNGANYDPVQDALDRSGVQEVELPGFGDGRPWKAKLRRLSLVSMAKAGKIPNPLIGAVTELYQTGTMKSVSLDKAAEVMLLMAQEALAEPTFQQLTERGAMLTDEQLTAIYVYAQRGVEALRPFRKDAAILDRLPDSRAVRRATQQLAESL